MYLAIVVQLSIIYSIQSAAQTDTKGACGCCTPGIPGIPGNHGTAGAMGPVGMAGLNGDKGLKGDTGLKGDKGTQGTNGKNGIGIPGKIGPAGIQGEAGVKGLTGGKGETGEIGLPGFTGETGVTGATGETGERGEQAIVTSKAKSAFSVAFKTSPGRLPVSPMKYETIFTNIGSDYSKETGKFVCQHPGTYVFQFTSQKSIISGQILTKIMKNGQGTVCAYEGGSTGSASNMVLLDLVAGDQVWTQPLSTTYNYYFSNSNAYCSFSGFLLYEA